MKYLLLFFALFFGLSAEAQTLRFEADTVYFTRSGVRFDHASVALQPFEDGSLGVVLSPLKELNDWERARIQQYLNSLAQFRGRAMRWADAPVDAPFAVRAQYPSRNAGTPLNSLDQAGRSLLAAPLLGLGGVAIATMSAFSDSPDAALVFGVAGGLASLVSYVRGCTFLIRAGKELEAAKVQQP